MFITFEGIEGCGKTTQMDRLEKTLAAFEVPFVRTLEPGGTPIGSLIRRILLDRKHNDLSPIAELCLYEADRAQHVEQVIRPALEKGLWVICDRFFDATTVYQGMARAQDRDLIEALNHAVTCGIRPDKTFLLDCPVNQGLERALKRNEVAPDQGQDRFEREKRNFHTAVRKGYLGLAQKEPERFIVIDASKDEDTVEREIFQWLKTLLPKT